MYLSLRLFSTTFGNPQRGAQVVHQRLKDFSFEPALRPLVGDEYGCGVRLI